MHQIKCNRKYPLIRVDFYVYLIQVYGECSLSLRNECGQIEWTVSSGSVQIDFFCGNIFGVNRYRKEVNLFSKPPDECDNKFNHPAIWFVIVCFEYMGNEKCPLYKVSIRCTIQAYKSSCVHPNMMRLSEASITLGLCATSLESENDTRNHRRLDCELIYCLSVCMFVVRSIFLQSASQSHYSKSFSRWLHRA